MENEEIISKDKGTNSLIILMGILGGKIDDLSRVLLSVDKHLENIEKSLKSENNS